MRSIDGDVVCKAGRVGDLQACSNRNDGAVSPAAVGSQQALSKTAAYLAATVICVDECSAP